jgi:hypothetical protein
VVEYPKVEIEEVGNGGFGRMLLERPLSSLALLHLSLPVTGALYSL